MTTRQHTCFTVICDVCGDEHENDESGAALHYEDREHAAEDARDHDWAATEDAVRAVCPAGDEAHDAAFTEVWTEHKAQETARTAAVQGA